MSDAVYPWEAKKRVCAGMRAVKSSCIPAGRLAKDLEKSAVIPVNLLDYRLIFCIFFCTIFSKEVVDEKPVYLV